MDFTDPDRGIDWRRWMWIVPEGANILPDGSWHRINDLSNGANQGPAMHALEACAGVDDTDPSHIRIMPRLPDPVEGIKVENHFVLVPGSDGLQKARVSYRYEKGGSFSLKSDTDIPVLSVRLGPYESREEINGLKETLRGIGLDGRIVSSGTFRGHAAWWLWVDATGTVREWDISLKE
jgi:hypothetical protein